MKTLFRLVLFLLVSFTLSCSEEPFEDPAVDDAFYVKKVQVSQEPVLQQILQNISAGRSSNGRLKTQFGEVNTDEAIKVNNPEDSVVRYTLLMNDASSSSDFENFVIRVKDDASSFYRVTYHPDPQWLFLTERDWRYFSGTIALSSLDDDDAYVTATLDNGVSVSAITSTGRNKSACCQFIAERTEMGWYVAIDCGEDFYWSSFIRSQECGGGDGGSLPGGYSNDGSTTGGGGGTGSYTGSGAGTIDVGGSASSPIGVFFPEYKFCAGNVEVPFTQPCPEESAVLYELCGQGQCIQNLLQNPCLRDVADHVLSPGIVSTYNTLIQDVFGSSETVNLTLIEGIVKGGDGETPQPPIIDANGIMNVTIKIDPTRVTGGSKEYIGSLIYHEAFHAIVLALSNGSSYTSDAHHISLFTYYLNLLSSGLHAAYPGMLLGDAKALILQGLVNKDGGQNPTPNKWSTTFVDEMLAYSNFPRSQISTVYDRYQYYHSSGHPCN